MEGFQRKTKFLHNVHNMYVCTCVHTCVHYICMYMFTYMSHFSAAPGADAVVAATKRPNMLSQCQLIKKLCKKPPPPIYSLIKENLTKKK